MQVYSTVVTGAVFTKTILLFPVLLVYGLTVYHNVSNVYTKYVATFFYGKIIWNTSKTLDTLNIVI